MSKATARTHWVWTEKAASNWDNRYNGRKRVAGQPIKDKAEDSREVNAAWLLRGYVCDAENYIPADGQMDLFEYLEAGLSN
ncbi:hypothetical protein [Paenibacillus alvei]|uniref:hypothetical protein n=1 Tax=Paenibacillus alvei TaxID=44250 RepID=UPI0013DC3632|nr:hypothetical protein [Paenibacillus alvei]NEZ45286.1 hypothetical protein [Paenibacillus alvei]